MSCLQGPIQTAVWVPGAWAGSWAEGGGAPFWSSDDGSNFPSCWHDIGSGLNWRERYGLLSFHTLGDPADTTNLVLTNSLQDRNESVKA